MRRIRDMISIGYKDIQGICDTPLGAIRCYQDEIPSHKQHRWDYTQMMTPSERNANKVAMDCYMMNNYPRDVLQHPLTKRDDDLINYLINLADIATKLPHRHHGIIPLYRGLSNPSYFKSLEVGQFTADPGFVSFSSLEKEAIRFAKDSNDGDLHILHYNMKNGDKGYYVDDLEHEFLLPRSTIFQLTYLSKQPSEIRGFDNRIDYYLRRFK